MVPIILVSHGSFCEGAKEAAEMILGRQDNLWAVPLAASMGPDELRGKLARVAGPASQVLFLVDLWGGTPFNQVSALLGEPGHEGWAAVTGLSVPMLVLALTEASDDATAVGLARQLCGDVPESIRMLPQSPDVGAAPQRQAHAAGEAPQRLAEEAVDSGARLKIVLARVDTRLLHGQVATAWTKAVSPDRIIVCSDAVAHDELRKSMIEQAAPPGVRAHVVPIAKIVEVARDPRFGATKAMLLFETPQDLLRALEGGVAIERANLGSMAHSAGKAVVTNVLAMDAQDVATLEAIASRGVAIDVRKVPSDTPASFDGIIRKAKELLA